MVCILLRVEIKECGAGLDGNRQRPWRHLGIWAHIKHRLFNIHCLIKFSPKHDVLHVCMKLQSFARDNTVQCKDIDENECNVERYKTEYKEHLRRPRRALDARPTCIVRHRVTRFGVAPHRTLVRPPTLRTHRALEHLQLRRLGGPHAVEKH